MAHLAFLCDHVCGYFCLSVLVFGVLVLSLGLHWKGGVFSSHRGPGGAGEAKRLSGWSLCVRVLPQHPGKVQHCYHMGGTPHSKEVSLCSNVSGGAGPRAGSPWWLSELQEGKRSALLQTLFFFSWQFTDIWPVLKSSRKSLWFQLPCFKSNAGGLGLVGGGEARRSSNREQMDCVSLYPYINWDSLSFNACLCSGMPRGKMCYGLH